MRRIATVALACAAGCGTAPPEPAHPTPAPAPAPVQTFEVVETPVEIEGPGITLEGVFAAPKTDQRVPAIVLIHGSGPLGRDERLPGQLGVQFGFEVAVFEQLSTALVRAGFAVVRYDKRTCTRLNGCDNSYPQVTDLHLDDLVADAQAVLGWLRKRPEVDTDRLFLVGHSQGGSFVPELMADNPDVRAAVMLAAPFRPIDRVSKYQTDHVERRLLEHNKHPAIIGIRLRQLKEISSGLRKLRLGKPVDIRIADAPLAYWQEWMALGDAAPALVQTLDRPLLALSGELDTNVPPSETELWREAFAAVHSDPGHSAQIVPCITHALNCVSRDDTGKLRPERDVSGDVVSRVVEFLNGT